MKIHPGDKKQAIFESTLDLIKDYGFHGTTMSLVAGKAGVAAGTVYHYFESKDQLICELYTYNRERVTAVIESSIDPHLSYKENFSRLWKSLYGFYQREPNVLIFFEQFINSPFSANKFPNYTKGILFDFFSSGVKKGVFRTMKPEFLLLLVMSSIISLAKLQIFGKKTVSNADQQRIISVLWEGMTIGNGQ